MLASNLHVNNEIKKFTADKIANTVPRSKRIGILGLAFKSGSDDVRLSPSKDIIEKLIAQGFYNIIAYDPMANEVFADTYKLPIGYTDTLQEIVSQADVLVLLTSWPEFTQNQSLISSKPLFDFRYALSDVPNALCKGISDLAIPSFNEEHLVFGLSSTLDKETS
jgi:UDPglucose 6-dehydrogenase